MNTSQVTPYGSWKSPITTELILATGVSLDQIAIDGDDIYWTEGRPQEGGRNIVVKYCDDGFVDMTSAALNVRTRVHEYGGGSFTVRGSRIYFSNFVDQRIYSQSLGEEPQALTPETAVRYADGVFAGEQYICVCEDHRQAGHEPINTLVSLKLDGADDGTVLVSGNDFYASPRVSPDGKQLVWLTWNHPNMPWDGTELWLADLTTDGQLVNARLIAGGVAESVVQPEWSPDGKLYFISDRTGWWNLYRWQDGKDVALYPQAAEFGFPMWRFGMRAYAFADAQTIICTIWQNSLVHLAKLDIQSGKLTTFDLPFTLINNVHVVGDSVVFMAASPQLAKSIIRLDMQTGTYTLLRQSLDLAVDSGYVSRPEVIEFPTADDLTAHAFYYPPQNKDYHAPPGERPPLLVLSHGGPTGAAFAIFSPEILYWTSRGFGVLDVNYGGSVGYGRAYRQRLNGKWGIVDVADCINGATYLAEKGLVDKDRLAIRGGSAGGYTTLCALTFHDLFSAGASHYGISDIEALAKETHKFESRYGDNLIGPYPEARDLYIARSPIHFVDQINCPLILFQGLEDKVVLPNQAEMMYTAVKDKGIPVAYMPFAGEQHGFRQAKNIKRALESELYFYGQVFGFEPADEIEPVEIANL